jgi:hypothetical protein
MKNVSLARIMYGTNEDFHSSTNAAASVLSQSSSPSLTDVADKTAAEQETFSELLHKAWTNLSRKR